MKKLIKLAAYRVARKTVLKPKYVKHCSQTLHQSLLAYIKVYAFTKDERWLNEIENLVSIILSTQHEDGGFDIGYDFDYGSSHRTGEPTTPEMLMLVALKKSQELVGDSKLKLELERSILKAEAWIINHSRKVNIGYEIPYSPYSDDKVVVNNAISFAIGALGINLNKANEKVFVGLKKNILSQLQHDEHGGYWHYYTAEQQVLMPADLSKKIDYYHIAQQLEMHSYAEMSNERDLEHYDAIKKVENKLVEKFLNRNQYKLIENVAVDSMRVHVWGLASIIPGLIASSALTNNEKSIKLSGQILDYLIEKSFKKNYFVPVLNPNGSHWDVSRYVRSDAWCIHAISCMLPYVENNKAKQLLNIFEAVVNKILDDDYSGIENHASSKGLEVMKKINFWIRRKL